MNPTLKAHILRYLAGMYFSMFQAGIHAVQIFCGVAGVHELSPGTVTALSLQQCGIVFLIAAGKAQLAYLDVHPPAMISTDFSGAPATTEGTKGT
jgi:hypothetical protein